MISKARIPIFRCLVLPKSNFSKCTSISRSSVHLSTNSNDDNTPDENLDVVKPDDLLSKLNKSPKKSKKSVNRETCKTQSDEVSNDLFSKLTRDQKKSNPDRQKVSKNNVTKSEEIEVVNDNNVEDLFSKLTGNTHKINSKKKIIKSEAKEETEAKKKAFDQDSDSLVSKLVKSTFEAKPPKPRKHTRPDNRVMKDSISGLGLKKYLSYDDDSPAIMACVDVNQIMNEDQKDVIEDQRNVIVQDFEKIKIVKKSSNDLKIEKQPQVNPESEDLSNLLSSLSSNSKNKRNLESMITDMNVIEDQVEEDFKAPKDTHEVHPELLMDHEMPVTNLRILDHLTPQLRMDLTNGVTVRKFRLKKLENWMKELREKGYPLPESLDKSQWDQILKYDGNRVTFYYLEAVWDQRDKDEQLLQHLANMDKQTYLPLNYNSEDLEDLIGDNPELRELWNIIEDEFEQLQMEGEDLWPHYNRLKLKLLFECSGDEERFRSYKFFTTRALSDVWDKVKNRQSKIACLKRLAKQKSAHIKQVIHKSNAIDYSNTFVGNVYEGVLTSDYYHWREVMEDFNEPMVFDLSHWTHVRDADRMRLTGHLYHALHYVNNHPEPIQTYLTGFDPKIMQSLHYDCQASIHGLKPETWTEKSYMDLFPREKLLYLTSDSPNTLEYSPDDIYIIGASSNSMTRNTSVNFAKENDIRHAKFPMKETIGLDLDLPLYTCALILMDYRKSRDWFYAFRWLYPTYFLRVLAYSKAYTYKQEYTYLTHRKLYPEDINNPLGLMNPQVYRAEYERYMSYAPKSDLEVISSKYNHELNQYKGIPRHVNSQKYLIK